jgi:ACS family D-galactonate transporter-like MFS transporter
MSSLRFPSANLKPVDDAGFDVMRRVVPLLTLSVFINYIDRGNLSIAAPMLKDELGISASQLGILLSSFFWTYGAFQFLSGWFVDRLNANWVLAAGFFLWSAATGATGCLHGFASLLIARLVLGIGESVAYPSYCKILAKHCPASRRGFANALIACGLACGSAFGMLLGGILMARFGWRAFFIAVSIISLFWLGPWLRWMPRGQSLAPEKPLECAPTTMEILKQRSAWGSCAGLFCFAALLYFMISWLPFYLVRERHFSMQAMAKIGGGMYLMQALCAYLSGRMADRWISAGGTRTKVHKTFIVVGLLLGGLWLVATSLAGLVLTVGLLILIGVSLGVCAPNIWAITQILAGSRATGRWTGLQNGFATSAGALSAAVTGFILDRTGHFFWALAVTAAICFVGALCWAFWVGPVEPVNWTEQRRTVATVGNVAADAA